MATRFLLAALIATASASTLARCKYPPQTSVPSPASSKPCHDNVQTFALQAVNCSNPYNGYYVETNGSGEDIAPGTFQLNSGDSEPTQFYLNGTTLNPVSSTTTDPSKFNSTTPAAIPYANNGRGQPLPAGPVALQKPVKLDDADGVLVLPCKIVKGYLKCTAPYNGGDLFDATQLEGANGPGTIYVDNFIPPHNPNDGDIDYEFGMLLKVINTCKL